MSSAESAPRYALTTVLLAVALLAGCGGGSDHKQASTAEAPAQAPPGAAGGAAPDEGGGAGTLSKDAPPQQVRIDPAADTRAVVYTATLRVRVAKVDDAAVRAKQLVLGAGGYVATESSSGGRADLTFKIPADRYTATLDRLSGDLGRRLSLGQEAEDVTEEVADVASRVRSAEAALASFRKLLDRADTVGEVINVEQEIARRQAELESLQARQKSLAHRTRYATVTLELVGPEPRDAEDHDDDNGGFLGGLERGWDALVAVGSGLAVAAGTLLPFVVVAGIVALPVLGVRRVLRGRRARRATAGGAEG
ncbi:MAG TPA: DUF4349 domain-containing protein [Thermomonospora sp.]|nr:DUF4349 domain-containing protein [Thermomonospora sp.]